MVSIKSQQCQFCHFLQFYLKQLQTFLCINFFYLQQLNKLNSKIMFSIPCTGSFTPVYFNWVFYDSSIYSNNSNQILDESQSKNLFTPILIASPNIPNCIPNEQISTQIKLEKKSGSLEKCDTQDEQYTPGNSNLKKMKKNQQNENRNIIPNIVNQILSYIQKKNKSLEMAEKIFDKYNTSNEWSVKRFYLYQNMLKNKISHYVNQQTLRIFLKTDNVDSLVYSLDQQKFYNKISRILIFHFLNTEAETSTLTSKRMDRSKKALHIKVLRQLSQKLRQIYKLL